jgi:hypothetical protein
VDDATSSLQQEGYAALDRTRLARERASLGKS